jgi:hypothetical protein
VSRITVPLLRTVVIALNASGNGVAQTGPFMNEVWNPTTCNINMSGAIPISGTPSTCTLSVGFLPAGSQFVDATYQVTGAASGVISGQVIYFGQYVFATWANGNANATAALTVSGTMTVPG